jgi:hypothetical protein
MNAEALADRARDRAAADGGHPSGHFRQQRQDHTRQRHRP